MSPLKSYLEVGDFIKEVPEVISPSHPPPTTRRSPFVRLREKMVRASHSFAGKEDRLGNTASVSTKTCEPDSLLEVLSSNEDIEALPPRQVILDEDRRKEDDKIEQSVPVSANIDKKHNTVESGQGRPLQEVPSDRPGAFQVAGMDADCNNDEGDDEGDVVPSGSSVMMDIDDRPIAAELVIQKKQLEPIEVKRINEDNSSPEDHWKKCIGFFIIVAIAVCLSISLTRTKTKTLLLIELEDICTYVNDKGPWLRGKELRDKEKEFLEIQFKDGTFAPILRGFATSVSMSYDGTRVAVAGRFGDEFHVFERDAGKNFTKAEWKVVGGVIPMLHSHMADQYEELEEHQSDVALSGDGTVVACGYPYYRADEEYDGKYEKWGAVAVYRIGKSGEWELMGKPFYGEGPREYLGQAVALSEDGTVVALGDYLHSRRTGRITVHKWNGENWTTIANIPGKDSGEEFGSEVSLSRDGTVVAASAQYGGADGNGEARVYRLVGGFGDPTADWMQMGTGIVAAPGYSYFGWPVSISGDGTRLATSSASFESDGDIEGGLDAGTVWIFEFNITTDDWKGLGDPIDGAIGGDGLGWGLALSANGRTVAAGGPNSDIYLSEAGYVVVYTYLCGSWVQMGNVIEGREADSWTGLSVSLSEKGEYLALGAPFDYSGEIGRPGYVGLFESPFDSAYIMFRTDNYGEPNNGTAKIVQQQPPKQK